MITPNSLNCISGHRFHGYIFADGFCFSLTEISENNWHVGNGLRGQHGLTLSAALPAFIRLMTSYGLDVRGSARLWALKIARRIQKEGGEMKAIERVPYMENHVVFKGVVYERTALQCPHCEAFLHRSMVEIPVHLTCMSDCDSTAAQGGTMAKDVETAFAKLEREVKAEQRKRLQKELMRLTEAVARKDME